MVNPTTIIAFERKIQPVMSPMMSKAKKSELVVDRLTVFCTSDECGIVYKIEFYAFIMQEPLYEFNFIDVGEVDHKIDSTVIKIFVAQTIQIHIKKRLL